MNEELPTRRGGRQRDPATDEAIIDAVLDMVAAGATLTGLSLVTIAKQAGVSRNSVYRRWKTKDELYLDVLETINEARPSPTGTSTRDDLAVLLQALAERVVDKRAGSMLRALNAEAVTFPRLHRRYFEEIVAPRREAMNQVLRRGVERGEIRSDVDPDLISELLVSPLLARMASSNTGQLDPVRAGRQIIDLVLDGAAAGPS
ncbi:TetR/AcrR family transcriptional regulator C-terminal ligand-binding domain-containing protein [Nonomuraea sediminis]|uniref:TetR/AcrR family transcriptional regulator C-terminal ligand-binding domain-containing protein n=1 Tax=Nonomuraea sediminis TaxID=2835864 RepID=UPI001BDC2364|nr:TetR/AcrR family transcriptional regulator C-terminal ligand-binding domain-containing protein [Nonomuraea sediminis]